MQLSVKLRGRYSVHVTAFPHTFEGFFKSKCKVKKRPEMLLSLMLTKHTCHCLVFSLTVTFS